MTQQIHVYTALVQNTDDFVGALAYSIYKQTKVEWVIAHKAEHGGAPPSPAEVAMFHAQNVLPVQLQGYRDRASALAAQFLAVATEEQVDQLTADTMHSALAEKFELTHQGITTEIASLKTEIGSLRNELASKRTFTGLMSEVGVALLVNVLTILVIGLIAFGNAKADWFSNLFTGIFK